MTTPRPLETIVEEQVRRWSQTQGRPAPASPCVALAHLPASGGDELGRGVAEQLGYGFFADEIVEALVRDQGVQGRLVSPVDERIRSVVDRYVVDAFRREGFTESDYLRGLLRVVQTLGVQGSAVLLGHGAPFILTAAQALRVLVVAPREARVERRAKRDRIAPAEAARALEAEDTERAEFARHHFGADPLDATRYELVVNTGTVSIDVAVGLVTEALARQFPAGLQAMGRTG
jgi:hypothetical protein